MIKFFSSSRTSPVGWLVAPPLALFLVSTLFLTSLPASAQSVETVVSGMQVQYEKQLETVETFVVETNHYSTYHERVVRDGTPTYRSATRLAHDGGPSLANGAPTTAYGFDFEQLKRYARYGGTETIGGDLAHLLLIDDPAGFDPEMDAPSDGDLERLTYFVSAERHLPVRMVMESKEKKGPRSTVTIDLKEYRTTDELTLPYRMEMRFDIGLSDEERREMEQMMAQLQSLPEKQREQMEKMMGEQMDMMTGVMSGEPVVVEVRSVRVNTELPSGIFSDEKASLNGKRATQPTTVPA